MAGSKTYFGRFVSADGTMFLVLISRLAEFDSVEGVTLGADAVRISYESDDKMSPVVMGRATVQLFSERDGQFSDLYSINGLEAELVVLRADGTDWELVWNGLIDPEFHEEPYSRPNQYLVTLRFSDLGCVKRRKWKKDRSRTRPCDLIEAIIRSIPRVPVSSLIGDKVRSCADRRLLIDFRSTTTIDGGQSVIGSSLVDTAIWDKEDGAEVSVYDVLSGLLMSFCLKLEIRGGVACVYDLESMRRSDGAHIRSRGVDAMMLSDRIYSEVSISTPLIKDKAITTTKHHAVLPDANIVELPSLRGYGLVSSKMAIHGATYSLTPVDEGKPSAGVVMFYDPTQTQAIYRGKGGVLYSFVARPSTKGVRNGIDGVDLVPRVQKGGGGTELPLPKTRIVKDCPAIYPSYMDTPHLVALLGAIGETERDTDGLMRAQKGVSTSRTVLSVTSVVPTPVRGMIRVGCELMIGFSPSIAQEEEEAGTNLLNTTLDWSIEDLVGGSRYQWVENPEYVEVRNKKWRAKNARLKVKIEAKNGDRTYSLKQSRDDYESRRDRIFGGSSTTIESAADRGDYMRYTWVEGGVNHIDMQFGYKAYNFGSWSKPSEKWWDISRLSAGAQERITPPKDSFGGGMLIPVPPVGCTQLTVSILDAFAVDYEDEVVRWAVDAGVAAPSYVLLRDLYVSSIDDRPNLDQNQEKFEIHPDAYEPMSVTLPISSDHEVGCATPARLLNADGSPVVLLYRSIERKSGDTESVSGTISELYARSVASQYGVRGRIIEGDYTIVYRSKPIEFRGEKYIRIREEINLRDSRSRMTLAQLHDDHRVRRVVKPSTPQNEEGVSGFEDLEDRERMLREILGPKVEGDLGKAKKEIEDSIETAKSLLEGLIRDSSLSVEYSEDGRTGWHEGGRSTDRYLRQRVGEDGLWSEAIRIASPGEIMVEMWHNKSLSVVESDNEPRELVAFVYLGSQDVSDLLPATAYRWSRYSDNTDADAVWAETKRGIGRRLTITPSECQGNADIEVGVPLKYIDDITRLHN